MADTTMTGFRGPDPRMNELSIDAQTGFMESSRADGVSAQLKLDILNRYRETGNMAAVCRVFGMEPRIIRWHMANDPAFKAAVTEAREDICDKAEGHIVEWMGSQKNVIDRLAWLRAHRPERWNPKAEVNVTHNTEVTVKLAEKARHALDTTAQAITTPPNALQP